MSTSHLNTRLVCRTAASPLLTRRRLSLRTAAVSAAQLVARRTYTARSLPTHAAAAPLATSGVTSSSFSDRADGSMSLASLPSPVEVHQVITRAVQQGRWEHAVRLLLGAIHSHCVPLAETYQLVLLSALRGGGWRAGVELTQQVATSSLSTTALYHTAADLLLSPLRGEDGEEGADESNVRTMQAAVIGDLVPLMLADATRHVAWKPRHREGVLRVVTEAGRPELVTALYKRWCAATATSSAASLYVCEEAEASLLMAAFASTGDWRSAESLRLHRPSMSSAALLHYVRSFTTALLLSESAPQSPRLVPWEVALDAVAHAQHAKGASLLADAAAELRDVARRLSAPTDVGRWWWSADTTVQAKLTELRRRCVQHSPAEAAHLLAQCHVAAAEVAELLRAVEEARVLPRGESMSLYAMQWLTVVLVLARYAPSALVSSDQCADGLSRLLPQPHVRLPYDAALAFASSTTSSCYVPRLAAGQACALWQCVAAFMLEDVVQEEEGAAARWVRTTAATFHYLLYTRDAIAQAKFSPPEDAAAAAADVTEAVKGVCAQFTRRLQALQLHRSPALSECREAIHTYLRCVSAHVQLPTLDNCASAVLCDAASTAAMAKVDASVVELMLPLEQLASPAVLCEMLCAAAAETQGSSAPAARAAYVLMMYACHPLRHGVALVALRPALQQVEALITALPTTTAVDALLLLCAQLQWCWGNSIEALRIRAVPLLLRRKQWAVLRRLLSRCPRPLSAAEERAAVMCAAGEQVGELQARVDVGDVAGAWAVWGTMPKDGDGVVAWPTSLQVAFVGLLLTHQRDADACHVLKEAPLPLEFEGCVTAAAVVWPQLGLRVCRHVLLNTEADVALADVWAVAEVGSRDVVKRETAIGLALCAAFALAQLQRSIDATQLLIDAAAYVTHYDDAHHYHHQQDGDGKSEGIHAVALRNTDAQLAHDVPLYVQCAMPGILLTTLSHVEKAEKASTVAPFDAAAVLRVAPYVFSLSARSAEVTSAWAAVLPAMHAVAATLAKEGGKEREEDAIAQAPALVLSLARSVLRHAVVQPSPVPLPLLKLMVNAAITTTTGASEAVLEDVYLALCSARDAATANPDTSLAAVQTLAAQVARFLAGHEHYVDALSWVDAFSLSTASGEAQLGGALLWRWVQASCVAERQRADTRAALVRRCGETEGPNGAPVSTASSLSSLEALIDGGAWAAAFSYFLKVVLAAPPTLVHARGGDVAKLTDAAMEWVELRDRCLHPRLLLRLLRCLASDAPWRTAMHALMLLCTHLPLLSWRVAEEAVLPALASLLSAMQRQAAAPHDMLAVLVWAAEHFSPSPSSLVPLQHIVAAAITATPAWAAAEGELCRERLRQLRGLLGERRVREAAGAIAATAASLSLSPLDGVHDAGAAAPVETWLPPARPLLHAAEVDALAVLAPHVVLASTPQLESLSRQHFDGRFQGFELKALLWWYRAELRVRVTALDNAAVDADEAQVQQLARSTALHERAAVLFAEGREKDEDEAVRWVVDTVFDGLLPHAVALRVWRSCCHNVAALAACRWSPLVEAELRSALLARHGRTPLALHTAPELSRRVIAHYWSCFRHAIEPDLIFSQLELCCLAAYAPAVTELRTRYPDTTQPGYAAAIHELASHVCRAHFTASRVPAEDTLAYVRRLHSPDAVAAVLSMAHKKLKQLHTHIYTQTEKLSSSSFSSPSAAGTVSYALPPHLQRHFHACAAALPSLNATPTTQQRRSLAAAVRGLNVDSTTCDATGGAVPVQVLEASCGSLPSLLLRSWMAWVTTHCATPRQPIPPAVSLLFVEWVKSAVASPSPTRLAPQYTSSHAQQDDDHDVGHVQTQWSAYAAAGQDEVQRRRCEELCSAWQQLSAVDAWPLMNAGHRAALKRMVAPTAAQVKALPTKTRGAADVSAKGKHAKSH